MSLIKKSTSAIGKFILVLLLAVTFLVGMVSVVYMSLQGEEIKVPEIVGKNFDESEKELALLGLRVKKRADRFSEEPPNTVLEQLPKPGDTVKTGQMILVVTSKATSDGTEAPMTIQKSNKDDDEKDDSEKIEELIDDKPKKTNSSNKASTNAKKKVSTTRDVTSVSSTKSNTVSGNNNSSTNSSDSSNNNSSNSNKSTTAPSNKSIPTTTPKPQPSKPGIDGGSSRPRITNP